MSQGASGQRVSLEREGRGTHEFNIDQVTVENLRRLFQVSKFCCNAFNSHEYE